jgi:hypothetical protein
MDAPNPIAPDTDRSDIDAILACPARWPRIDREAKLGQQVGQHSVEFPAFAQGRKVFADDELHGFATRIARNTRKV